MITALKYEVADIVKKATPEELELIIHTLYLEVERYKHAFQRAEALMIVMSMSLVLQNVYILNMLYT